LTTICTPAIDARKLAVVTSVNLGALSQNGSTRRNVNSECPTYDTIMAMVKPIALATNALSSFAHSMRSTTDELYTKAATPPTNP
jgi:hypothetical protein